MPLSAKETVDLAAKSSDALGKAKTKDQVVEVWKAAYGSLGHKALGRMLVGTHDQDDYAKKQESLKGDGS